MTFGGGYGGVYVFHISVHFTQHIIKTTQDAEREMHEVQYLYVAFPRSISSGTQKSLNYF